jgi:exosortase
MSQKSAARNLSFLLFSILSLVPFWVPLNALVRLSFHDERYSHIIVIPFITVCLLYLERRRIFLKSQYCPSMGIPLLLMGLGLYCVVRRLSSSLDQNGGLSLLVLAIVLVWTGGFVFCYGMGPVRAASFPLLFLFLIIPIPTILLEKTVLALQKGSAEMAYVLFKLAGVPVFRQGFVFSLPGVDIEIAEECSGIRSSLALFITGILAGYVFLQSRWRRVCLGLLTVPIVIFKNAVRIVTISWLGTYVDRGFFYGKLHRYGGLPFSLLALAILALVLFVLRRSEARRSKRAGKTRFWSALAEDGSGVCRPKPVGSKTTESRACG